MEFGQHFAVPNFMIEIDTYISRFPFPIQFIIVIALAILFVILFQQMGQNFRIRVLES